MEATRGLQDSLRQARSEYEALRARSAGAPSSTARMIAPPAASIRHTQASLRTGELLVEYFVTDERLMTFVVSPSAFKLIEQPIHADSLGARVGLARELMGSPESDDGARKVLSLLHTALIAPVMASGMVKDIRTLVVVPHGLLTYLPFAALVDPASNRFLVEDVAVLVSPSAAVFATLRAADRPASARGGVTLSVYALAPFTRTLPGSLAELRGVKAAVPGMRDMTGDAATKRALRRVLQEDAIVHVASHAAMNPGNPLFSRIELAGGDRLSSADDGRVEVREILGLDVRSPLVFLSGCETALGSGWTMHVEDRKDFTSMAHAWLVAGARNVVATLWRIDDAAAAEFTGHFYRALPSSTVPEALAVAQRAMIKDSRLRRPYLWAAYQAVGDGRAPLNSASTLPESRSAKSTMVSVSR